MGALPPPRRRKLGLAPPPLLNPVYGPGSHRALSLECKFEGQLAILMFLKSREGEHQVEITRFVGLGRMWIEEVSFVLQPCGMVGACTRNYEVRMRFLDGEKLAISQPKSL